MAARAKICGLTRPEDAATAVLAGASYLGVVFAGGPRQVSVRAAGEISAAAGRTPVFGVYGDQTVDEILRITAAAGLCGAQLHGPYSASAAERLRSAGLQVWRVVRIAVPGDLETLDGYARAADGVLVEPMVKHAAGGAGIALDLTVAREARTRLSGCMIVLAGGLTPDTVGEAAAFVGADVVDVSSGVESLPGIKDPEKIARFMEAVCGHSAIS